MWLVQSVVATHFSMVVLGRDFRDDIAPVTPRCDLPNTTPLPSFGAYQRLKDTQLEEIRKALRYFTRTERPEQEKGCISPLKTRARMSSTAPERGSEDFVRFLRAGGNDAGIETAGEWGVFFSNAVPLPAHTIVPVLVDRAIVHSQAA